MNILKTTLLASTTILSIPAATAVNASTIGEVGMVDDMGFESSKYEQLMPTGQYENSDLNYPADEKATVERLNGYDMIRTPYAHASHVNDVRYSLVALVDPDTLDVPRASLRIISETGTGDFDLDNTVSDRVKAANPRRDFTKVIDEDGRVFDLTYSRHFRQAQVWDSKSKGS